VVVAIEGEAANRRKGKGIKRVGVQEYHAKSMKRVKGREGGEKVNIW